MTNKFLIACFLVFSCFSCNSDPWSNDEKNIFIDECREEGGDKSYCHCYLEKTMEYSPIAEEADRIAFEVKIESTLGVYCG